MAWASSRENRTTLTELSLSLERVLHPGDSNRFLVLIDLSYHTKARIGILELLPAPAVAELLNTGCGGTGTAHGKA
jgi:hypothetical protein